MGRKCSTVFNGKPCTSGYATNNEKVSMHGFPTDQYEKERWVKALPNINLVENVIKNMAICRKHWPPNCEMIKQGGYERPADPPSIFGDTPISFQTQTMSNIDRNVCARGVTVEQRMKVTKDNVAEKELSLDTIKTWEELSDFCKKLPLAVEVSSDNISIYKVSDMHVKYSLIIHNDFYVTAKSGLKVIPVRNLISYKNNKLEQYSQLKAVLDHLDMIPIDIDNELKHAGQRLLELSINEISDEKKKKSIEFLCDQLLLHGTNRARYNDDAIRNAMNLFLRSRNAYKALRQLLILPSDKTLRGYFGKLGSSGSAEECKLVVQRIFDPLEDNKTFCYITADEIYVKPSIRYRANHIIGFAVDQEEPCPAKTILALMVNFFLEQPAFVARLIPVNKLLAEFLYDQLLWLIKIVHEAGGKVVFVMTDNLRVNQKMFKMFHEIHESLTFSSVFHPIPDRSLPSLHLIYDPTHALKNIRNNWINEKTQSLKFVVPDTNETITAKWNHLKIIYKTEQSSMLKDTKLDHCS